MTRIFPSARPRMILAAALCLFGWPAAANDQALIDFVGYSGDFRYFAFEEYGTLDGSGSAYSNIHILDLWTDKEMPGSPFSAEGREDDKTLAQIRREAGDAAGADLKKLAIDTPVQIAALLGDGIAGAGSEMHFAFPSTGGPGSTQGDYKLALESFYLAPTPACAEDIADPGKGFALSVSGDGKVRETTPRHISPGLARVLYRLPALCGRLSVRRPRDRQCGGDRRVLSAWLGGGEPPLCRGADRHDAALTWSSRTCPNRCGHSLGLGTLGNA